MSDRPSLRGYPVNLLVADRRCVVVGGGRIAARKVDALLDAGARVHVVARELGDELRALRDAGRVTVDEREFVPGDLDGAWLATAATRFARRQRRGVRCGRGAPHLGERRRRSRALLLHAHVGGAPGRRRA